MPAGSLGNLLRPSRSHLAGFLLFFAVAAVVVLKGGGGGAGIQPIAFNHSKHVASGMGCTDCHVGAETQQHATIPEIATCMTCHENPLTKSVGENLLRSFAAAGREVGWRPVTHVAPHVFFSHREHVAIAGLTCQTCHGAMEKLTAPPLAPLRPLTMAACIGCHENKKAGSDCNDCHR